MRWWRLAGGTPLVGPGGGSIATCAGAPGLAVNGLALTSRAVAVWFLLRSPGGHGVRGPAGPTPLECVGAIQARDRDRFSIVTAQPSIP